MGRSTCDCGAPILRAVEDLGCIECGRPCCPVRAYTLESVAYCAFCAAQFLEPAGLRRGRGGERLEPVHGLAPELLTPLAVAVAVTAASFVLRALVLRRLIRAAGEIAMLR